MIDKNNYIGLSGFVWWVGIIENRKDPLKMHRCQVRIIGWHTDNKAQLPTSDLPWAQVLLPVNLSRVNNPPSLGDWVVGFFMDGESAQFPVIMGVMPGIKQPQNNKNTSSNNIKTNTQYA